MKLIDARKISVVGNSGAGKSTVSSKLARSLKLGVYTIDQIYWLPDWQVRDKKSYKQLHDEWLSHTSWLIDGIGYWSELKERLLKSDLVIFLDVPVKVCIEHALDRIAKEKLNPNPHVTKGCIYGEVKERQMELIEYFQSHTRPELIALLESLKPGKVKTIHSGQELGI